MYLYKLIVILIFVCINISVAMGSPFSDISEKHWSYEAVKILKEKKIVDFYEDDNFNGERPVSRYEMAIVVAKIIVKLQQIEASVPENVSLLNYIDVMDLELINKLMNEYKTELDYLGIKVKNKERNIMLNSEANTDLMKLIPGDTLKGIILIELI